MKRLQHMRQGKRSDHSTTSPPPRLVTIRITAILLGMLFGIPLGIVVLHGLFSGPQPAFASFNEQVVLAMAARFAVIVVIYALAVYLCASTVVLIARRFTWLSASEARQLLREFWAPGHPLTPDDSQRRYSAKLNK